MKYRSHFSSKVSVATALLLAPQVLGISQAQAQGPSSQQEPYAFSLTADRRASTLSRADSIARTLLQEVSDQKTVLNLLEQELANIDSALSEASLSAESIKPEVRASIMAATAVGFAVLGTWALTNLRAFTSDGLMRSAATYGMLGASALSASAMSGYTAYWEFFSESQVRESLQRRRKVLDRLITDRSVAIVNLENSIVLARDEGNIKILTDQVKVLLLQRQTEFERLTEDLKIAQAAFNQAESTAGNEKNLKSIFTKVTIASSVATTLYLLTRLSQNQSVLLNSTRSLPTLKTVGVFLLIMGPSLGLSGQKTQLKIAQEDLERARLNVESLQAAAKAAQKEIISLQQDIGDSN